MGFHPWYNTLLFLYDILVKINTYDHIRKAEWVDYLVHDDFLEIPILETTFLLSIKIHDQVPGIAWIDYITREFLKNLTCYLTDHIAWPDFWEPRARSTWIHSEHTFHQGCLCPQLLSINFRPAVFREKKYILLYNSSKSLKYCQAILFL